MRSPPRPAQSSPAAAGRPGGASAVPVLSELLVDPRVQSGQRGLDRGERVFEVVVVAVVRVVDVENESARTRVEGSQHPDPTGIDAQLLKKRYVVAGQRNHQVGVEMVDVDLGGNVVGGVAVPPQHAVGALVSSLADVPTGGSRAGYPYRVVQAAFGDLVGEHLLSHRRPADVAGAHEGDVQL